MPQNPGNEVPLLRLYGGPNLMVDWPSGFRVFFRNLRDLVSVREEPQPWPTSPPAPFWPDVFVDRPVVWRSMASSALYHVFLVVVIYGFSVTWAQRAPLKVHSPFDNSKITYYSVSEYLPEIDAGSAPAKEERKGEPKYAKQRIISIPPAPDNFRQTIITPSQIKLPNDVAMPNLVAWTPVPSPVPEAALTQTPSQLKLPQVPVNVVAPAPDPTMARSRVPQALAHDVVAPAASTEALRSRNALNVPAPDVIEPPVSAAAAARPLGSVNMARLEPTVAAPKLPIAEQRAAMAGSSGGAQAGNGGSAAVQPAPNVAGLGNGKQPMGQLIALGLDPPAVNGPISVPQGSRQGQFAATPEGNPNAVGTPDIKGGGGNGLGGSGRGSNGGGSGSAAGPPGISVGPGASQPSSGVVAQGDPAKANVAKQPTMMASLDPSRVADLARASRPSSSINAPAKIEDRVFGGKRYYSMTLNMPNLTSAGGSWIIRFAELNESSSKGDVAAPQPTLKVDPAYPAELMRDRVEGTVTLYAVIHKDGTVGEVRVLRGVEERLDENAKVALSRWKFRPATKDGSAVDLEAVVQIPFAVRKMPF
jgi:TonB family protein